MKKLVLSFIMTLVFTGCAVKVNTVMIMPAKESEVTLYKNIAVFPFTGNGGYEIAQELESILYVIELQGSKMFKLAGSNSDR